MSHPLGDGACMNKRIQSKPVVSLSALVSPPPTSRSSAAAGTPVEREAVESGLLRLCEEIAGTLLRRRLESGDPADSVRATRRDLVRYLPDCDEARAGWLVDLALELLHVKSKGRFRRNALELSQLIARAGNQLRELSDN